jgi:CheY-like chemotaxis protein
LLAVHALVVEDDTGICESLVDLLRAEGYSCAQARDGRCALRLLDALARPCVIILDLEMPVLDGNGFLAELSKRPDRLDFPVIVSSGHPRAPSLRRDPGVVAILGKPYGIEQLLGILSALPLARGLEDDSVPN